VFGVLKIKIFIELVSIENSEGLKCICEARWHNSL
jgi:hypothetical protein